jgi:hypothetical protein
VSNIVALIKLEPISNPIRYLFILLLLFSGRGRFARRTRTARTQILS